MKNILIIGMGKFGEHLALKLKSLGDEVCIVDDNAEKIAALSNKITNAYVADCTNIDSLKDLGIKQYDVCVVAIGENFQSSLEITALLKELHAKKIVAKANSEIQSKFLTMAGADDIIYPEYKASENTLIVTDLLADVIIYPDGFVKVVDLDEMVPALDSGGLSIPLLKRALTSCNALLAQIYAGKLDELLAPINALEV